MRRITCCFLLLLSSFYSIAQISINGQVLDQETNEPLAFASVYQAETEIGTVTDIEGNFQLLLSKPGILQISYIGYESAFIDLEKDTVLIFYLKPSHTIIACPQIFDSPILISLPAPFMQMKKEQLARDEDLSLLPILNRVPGLHMQSGNLNTNRISLRGIGSRSPYTTSKIRIYLDDIPLTSGNGESTIEDIDLSLIDEVDIWKGPAASVYGAGLGGLIHLKTEKRTGSQLGTIYSKTTLGSFGLFRNSSGFRTKVGDQGGYLRANYHLTSIEGYRQNSGFRREGLNIIGKMPVGENTEISFLSLYTTVQGFIPSSLNETDFINNPEKAADSWNTIRGFEAYKKLINGISLKSKLLENGTHDLIGKASFYSSFQNGYESRPFNILDDAKQALGLRASLSLDEGLISGGIYPFLSVGVEIFQDLYQWQTLETNNGQPGLLLSNSRETRQYYHVFSQIYKEFDSGWTLLLGLNLSQTSYHFKDLFFADTIDLSGDYSFKPSASIRIGGSYRINFNHSIFASISDGYSPPSLEETLTPEGGINPEILPEHGWNFEFGARGRLLGKLHYELSIYRMLVKDLLVAKRIGPDQYVGQNAGKTLHDGLEVFLDWRLDYSKFTIRPYLSCTYTNYRFLDFIDGEDDFSGNKLTGVAPLQILAGTDFSFLNAIYGNLDYEYRSAFPMLDDNSKYSDAYNLLHLKLAYRKTFDKGWSIDLFGGIRNLLDTPYASMILINAPSFGGNAPRFYYPGMPRNFFGGLEIRKVF